MLDLYHHGSSVCAAKVRFALAEKQVEADNLYYIDILNGEQFTDEYRKINPKAVVPSLVHNNNIINESTVICEYIDEAFDGPSLLPDSAFDKTNMRIWTKAVDEELHPACGELTFVCSHRFIIMRLGEEKLKAFLASTPDQSVTNKWKERKKEIVTLGFDAPNIKDTIRLYDRYLQKMEDTLKSNTWLAGETFSLADIGLTPYVNRLDMLKMSGMWENGRLPAVENWFNRIKQNTNFKKVFLDWCPPALTEDLATFGTQSWPEIRNILDIET